MADEVVHVTRRALEVVVAGTKVRAFCVVAVLALAGQAVGLGGAQARAAEAGADKTSAKAAEAEFAKVPFAKWGAETLARIEKDLGQPGSALYAEYGTPDGRRGSDYGKYSFIWPASFQLRALAAAAAVAPRRYRQQLVRYTNALEQHWKVRDDIGGYMVLPGDSERLYDDNAWMVLGLLDACQVAGQKKYLDRGAKTMAFLVSGEKKTPGAGIRQHETKTEGGTAVCTTAPATVGALRLYRITKNPNLLKMAERWYAWLTSKEVAVQDPADGLLHQGAELKNGKWEVCLGKRAYQSSLPIQAAVLFYQIKKDEAYLKEAQRIAAACLEEWVQPGGGLKETGQWGGSDLVDALLDLYQVDKDPRWLTAVRQMLEFLHEKGRDPNGRYGEYWHEDHRGKPLERFHLLYMAPVARAYWRAAGVGGRP